VPVIKITGNAATFEKLKDHMDLSVAAILEGKGTVNQMGEAIYREIVAVASGKRTKAEITGYFSSMDIYVTGPVI
jgi:altronate dehydratase large subunit